LFYISLCPYHRQSGSYKKQPRILLSPPPNRKAFRARFVQDDSVVDDGVVVVCGSAAGNASLPKVAASVQRVSNHVGSSNNVRPLPAQVADAFVIHDDVPM
jgi:hypothetical protein